MTDPDEPFDIFTEAGEPLGQAPRGRVHAEGLWHRSAQVFLFDGRGRLYLQRRVATKDVCGGLWDQSVAEHLKPGESYLEGACRGLAEELGVRGVSLEPVGGILAARLDLPEQGIHDYEIQQAFRGHYRGALDPEPSEVDAVCAVELSELAAWLARSPEAFTPWFRRDVIRCGILPAP